MSLFGDLLNDTKQVLGVNSVMDIYTQINQAEINKGVAKTNQTIAELNAGAELLRLQNQARQTELLAQQGGVFSSGGGLFANMDIKKIGGYALLIGGVFLAYKVLVK